MAEPMKVIIVDDEPDICDMLHDVLDMRGYDSNCANGGTQAVEMARETRFDLAVVDYKMPMMNGLEAARKLREINPGIKIIMISGYAPEEDLLRAVEEGALKALKKPFSFDEFFAAVEGAIGPAA